MYGNVFVQSQPGTFRNGQFHNSPNTEDCFKSQLSTPLMSSATQKEEEGCLLFPGQWQLAVRLRTERRGRAFSLPMGSPDARSSARTPFWQATHSHPSLL